MEFVTSSECMRKVVLHILRQLTERWASDEYCREDRNVLSAHKLNEKFSLQNIHCWHDHIGQLKTGHWPKFVDHWPRVCVCMRKLDDTLCPIDEPGTEDLSEDDTDTPQTSSPSTPATDHVKPFPTNDNDMVRG